ncbi:MAG: energy-coupling factor transporter transmembrane component T, partial [Fervidobacterium sp.]
MKLISLYVEKDTFIHNLAPFTKLTYAFTSVAITLMFPSLVVGIIFFCMSLLICFLARVTKHMLNLLSVVTVLSISLLIIQGMFYTGNKTVLFSVYKLSFYKEGLIHAALLILRLFNMIISFGILILTTRPSDLIDNLIQKGLSPRLGYVLSSVLQIIPQMLSTASTIMDAQRSRGLD